MKNLSLFVDRDTFIHKLNPLTKIIYVIFAVTIPFLIGEWQGFIIMILCSIVLLSVARVLRQAIPLLLAVSLLLVTVIIVQSLFGVSNQTVLFTLGNIPIYQEGLFRSLRIALNVINLVLAFGLFILTTKPSSITEAITSWGWSPKIAYIFGSVFQIIPELASTLNTIMDAQRSRGTETEGNLFIRVKAFLPLISPVIMNSLVITKERAIALEVRGFNIKGKKTSLNNLTNTKLDIALDILLLGVITIIFIWRLITWGL